MTGKYAAAAIAFILALAGAGLAQLRPAFGADWDAQDSQMQMDMSGHGRSGDSFVSRLCIEAAVSSYA